MKKDYEPSAIQLISYIASNLEKGAILTDWELEENLTPLGYKPEQVQEALNLMSGLGGIHKIFLKEKNVYTLIIEPKNIRFYIPSDMELDLEEKLKYFILKKEN